MDRFNPLLDCRLQIVSRPINKVKVDKLIDRYVKRNKYFIGIDISILFFAGKTIRCRLLKRSEKSLTSNLKRAYFVWSRVYTITLWDYLSEKNTAVWLESALRIKPGWPVAGRC